MGPYQSKQKVQLFGRLHSDICNVITYLLPGVKLLQIKLTKFKRAFYLMNMKTDSSTILQFFVAFHNVIEYVRISPF